MTQIFDMIREGQRQRAKTHQHLETGIVIGLDQTRYDVSAGGITYSAECGIASGLKRGDRVWLVLGNGSPKIVGIYGRDEEAH